jgi:hypothetical protein
MPTRQLENVIFSLGSKVELLVDISECKPELELALSQKGLHATLSSIAGFITLIEPTFV